MQYTSIPLPNQLMGVILATGHSLDQCGRQLRHTLVCCAALAPVLLLHSQHPGAPGLAHHGASGGFEASHASWEGGSDSQGELQGPRAPAFRGRVCPLPTLSLQVPSLRKQGQSLRA